MFDGGEQLRELELISSDKKYTDSALISESFLTLFSRQTTNVKNRQQTQQNKTDVNVGKSHRIKNSKVVSNLAVFFEVGDYSPSLAIHLNLVHEQDQHLPDKKEHSTVRYISFIVFSVVEEPRNDLR